MRDSVCLSNKPWKSSGFEVYNQSIHVRLENLKVVSRTVRRGRLVSKGILRHFYDLDLPNFRIEGGPRGSDDKLENPPFGFY